MRLGIILFILLSLTACTNKYNYVFKYGEDKSAVYHDSATIVFGSGFENDKLVLEYAKKTLLDTTTTTEPSSGMATDFFTVTKKPPYDSYFVELNGSLLQIPVFKEYATVHIFKHDKTVTIEYTNRLLKFD